MARLPCLGSLGETNVLNYQHAGRISCTCLDVLLPRVMSGDAAEFVS